MFTIRTAVLCIACLTVACGARAATLTLDNPDLVGAPGDTVGWGFTLTSTPVQDGANTITPWLVVSSAAFVLDAGVFPVGVFTPFITSSFTVIGPDDQNGEVNPWSQPFDNAQQTGIGSDVINPFQSPGDLATGNIVLTFDEFRVSPNDSAFDPISDTIATGLTLSAPASVLVAGPGDPAPIPEPASFSLVTGAVMIGAALVARRR